MQLKRRIIFLAQQSILDIQNLSIDAEAAYNIAKNIPRLQEELTAIEVARQKIMERLGVDKEANIEFNEFLDRETEISLTKIPVSAIAVPIKPKILIDLNFMIKNSEVKNGQTG